MQFIDFILTAKVLSNLNYFEMQTSEQTSILGFGVENLLNLIIVLFSLKLRKSGNTKWTINNTIDSNGIKVQ